MKKILLVLLAGGLLVFNGCAKKGPKGDPGPQGNANVIGSDPFGISTWQFNTGENAYWASFNDADVTSDISAHGTVEVFLYYPSDGTWRNLPDILNGTEFYSRFNTGGFDIYYANIDGTTPSNPGNNTFRTVIISASQKQAHPNTNWKNYNEAVAALNSVSPAVTQ
jgi:hypothetical protein